MVAVKLTKHLSYNGYGIRATRDNPIVRTDTGTAAALVTAGHFEYLDAPEPVIATQDHKPARPKRAKK